MQSKDVSLLSRRMIDRGGIVRKLKSITTKSLLASANNTLLRTLLGEGRERSPDFSSGRTSEGTVI